MPTGERAGLKAAFAGFKRSADDEAEMALLGRTIDTPSTNDTQARDDRPGAAAAPAFGLGSLVI